MRGSVQFLVHIVREQVRLYIWTFKQLIQVMREFSLEMQLAFMNKCL